MIFQTIVESTNGREVIKSLIDLLEETSADFAEDRKRCDDAVAMLRTANLTPSVDDEIDAIHRQALSNLLFSGFLGFKANWDHYINPVERTFMDVDFDVFLCEATAKKLPEYECAQIVRLQFYSLLTPNQRIVYEDIAAYGEHLETVIPKLGHYYGFLLGNFLLPHIVLGYCPDQRLTMQYRRRLEAYLGLVLEDIR